jgi:hypothetical protein
MPLLLTVPKVCLSLLLARTLFDQPTNGKYTVEIDCFGFGRSNGGKDDLNKG